MLVPGSVNQNDNSSRSRLRYTANIILKICDKCQVWPVTHTVCLRDTHIPTHLEALNIPFK